MTEIYDYLKLLYARIGKTYSPISGKEVKNHQISDIVDFIFRQEKETVCLLTTKLEDCEIKKLNTLLQQGYSRILINNKVEKINNILEDSSTNLKDIYLVIDRIVVDKNIEENKSRIIDSVETSFFEGKGECIVWIHDKDHHFSNKFELDGMMFEKNSVPLFLLLIIPMETCKKCEGFWYDYWYR